MRCDRAVTEEGGESLRSERLKCRVVAYEGFRKETVTATAQPGMSSSGLIR